MFDGVDNADVANNTVADRVVANGVVGGMMNKAGGNWVAGESSFDRDLAWRRTRHGRSQVLVPNTGPAWSIKP